MSFRREVREQITELLVHWRDVEKWVKKSEHVSGEVVIPAINELRYAGRQLFFGLQILAKTTPLTEINKKHIRKRIIIAEQYLTNADHDICDAMIGYLNVITNKIDLSTGSADISKYFPEYPEFKKTIRECIEGIVESRADDSGRGATYREIREKKLPFLLKSFDSLRDADVQARVDRENLEGQLAAATKGSKAAAFLNGFAWLMTVVAIPLSVYLWHNASNDICLKTSLNLVDQIICWKFD